MADMANCDVCGRFVNLNSDEGGLFNKKGGYACSRCTKWAQKRGITCPKCHRPVIVSDYHSLCDCDGVTVTRKPRKEG